MAAQVGVGTPELLLDESRPALTSARVTSHPNTNPPTWAKNATPPPPPWREQAEVRLEQLVQEPEAQEEPRGDRTGKIDQPAHRRARVEHEVGAQHGRDRPAARRGWAPGRPPPSRTTNVIGVCVAHGDKAAGDVEGEVAEVPNASSTFLPKTARNSMLPRMWSQLPCMNIAVNQLIPHGSGAVARAVHGARIERRVVDRESRCGSS